MSRVKIVVLLLVGHTLGLNGSFAAGQGHGDIVHAIDQAEEDRETKLAGYSVEEIYQVYKPGDDNPIGERIVQTTYVRGKGKTHVEVAGSRKGGFMEQYAIDQMLNEQEELSKPQKRRSILPISPELCTEFSVISGSLVTSAPYRSRPFSC